VGHAAAGAEQLFESFVAQHQHRVGVDHEAGFPVVHATGLELLRGEQMEEMLAAVAFDALLGVGRAEQFSPLGPTVAAFRTGILTGGGQVSIADQGSFVLPI
jgi:hypothetical protein